MDVTAQTPSKAFDIAPGNSMGQEINVFNASTTTTIKHDQRLGQFPLLTNY
jgi:hypothetical protein